MGRVFSAAYPLAIGDLVWLRCYSRWATSTYCGDERFAVEVTSKDGELYTGEVVNCRNWQSLPPDTIRRGSPIQFTMAFVQCIGTCGLRAYAGEDENPRE